MDWTKLKAVLLDIDGTLIDSNDAHARAWVDVLRRHGYKVSYEATRPLIGKGGDKLLQELIGLDDETAEGKRIADERKALFQQRDLPQLAATDGARALLEALRARGLRLVVATSAGNEEVDGLLKQAGLDGLVDEVASSSDADASKPDPDIVVAALEKAGLQPHEAVMLGDTPFDVASARAAGLDTIALRCGGWWDDDALGEAIEIHAHPRALLEALAATPVSARTTRSG